MTYVYLDADGLQTLINNLSTYATTTLTNKESVSNTNTNNSSPTDLTTFNNTLGTKQGELEEKYKDLQTRLDAAKAANESGLTSTGADGKIAYYVPDGQEDTTQVVTDANGVEAARQAWADADTVVKYSEDGCSAEQWDALLSRMQSYQDDPAYATALLSKIGKGRLLDLPTDMADRFDHMNQHTGTVRSDRPDAGTDLADALGHVLASASTTWSADKANEYGNGLIDEAEKKGKDRRIGALNRMLLASQETDIDGDGAMEQVGLDYNDDMLVTMAQRLEKFDPQDVGFFDKENWDLSRTDLPVVGPNRPLDGIVHAMTGNTSAADTWLTVHEENGDVDPNKTAERTAALAAKSGIGDNRWTNDWTLLAAQEAITGNSGTPEVGDGTAQAAIVAGALDAVGEGGKVGGSGQDKITLSDAARNAASIALSSYPYGFQRSALTEDRKGRTVGMGDGSWAGDMPDQPLLTNKALANLVGQVGENNAALARLAGSQEAFNKIQTTGEAAKDDPQPLSTALNDQANARGFVAGAIARQHEDDAKAKDERVGAWAKAASTAVNAVPLPQAKGAGAVLNVATNFVTNAGKSAAAKGAEEGTTKMFGGNEDKTKDNEEAVKASGTSSSTINETLMLLDSGEYSQEDLAKAVKNSDPDDVSSVLNSDGTLNIDPSSISYDSITSEQESALLTIADKLPSDGHAPLTNFGKNNTGSYSSGYDVAHGQ
jgi:hypothetical protein